MPPALSLLLMILCGWGHRHQLNERISSDVITAGIEANRPSGRSMVAQLPFGYEGPVSVIEPPLIAAK